MLPCCNNTFFMLFFPNFIVTRVFSPYNEIMTVKKPRNVWWLVAGIFGLSGLGWFINTFGPNSFVLILLFFLIVFFTSLCFFLFLLNNVRRAILLSLGVSLFFFLRLLNLREPFYIILLVASIVSLDVYFRKR